MQPVLSGVDVAEGTDRDPGGGEQVVGAVRVLEGRHRGRDGDGGLGQVLVDQPDEDGVLVGEVLVDRAERQRRRGGDAVGGPCGVAVLTEDRSCRREDASTGFGRTRLTGLLAR